MHCLQLLVEHGADVNARANDGNSPLHMASREGDADAVNFLLEAGADPSILNGQNQTPLEVASIWAEEELQLAHTLRAAVQSKAQQKRLESKAVVEAAAAEKVAASAEHAASTAASVAAAGQFSVAGQSFCASLDESSLALAACSMASELGLGAASFLPSVGAVNESQLTTAASSMLAELGGMMGGMSIESATTPKATQAASETVSATTTPAGTFSADASDLSAHPKNRKPRTASCGCGPPSVQVFSM